MLPNEAILEYRSEKALFLCRPVYFVKYIIILIKLYDSNHCIS